MPTRPAVIIGVGSSGSEVVVEIYKKFQEYLKIPGNEGHKNIVQFLLIDSATPAEGSDDLVTGSSWFPVGAGNGDALFDSMWRNDDFFHEWWYEKFTHVGVMFPGCGTVSPKGRLAFWDQLGNPGNNRYFAATLKNALIQAGNAAPRKSENAIVWVPVYIIGTICGGTGAGMAIDIGYLTKQVQITQSNAEVHGIFMLPSVPKLRAQREVHQHITANGYGFLAALNYWMTKETDRPVTISPFMKRMGMTLDGKRSPYDICWLISQENEDGCALLNWPDIKTQVADSVSMMIFEDKADFGSRFNDLIGDPSVNSDYNGQPIAYGSFASYAVRYSPEKVLTYLANRYAQHAVEAYFTSPSEMHTEISSMVTDFIKVSKIQEKSPDPNKTLDEVINTLRVKPADVKLYDSVNIDADLKKRDVNKKNLGDTLKTAWRQQKVRLDGELTGVPGVSFRAAVIQNRESLEKKVSSDLYTAIRNLITNKVDGAARAVAFLNEFDARIKDHRSSIDDELKGDLKKAIKGNEAVLQDLESDEHFKTVISTVSAKMFGIFENIPAGIQTFKRTFWTPWQDQYKTVLVKREVLVFYDNLLLAKNNLLRDLSQYATQDLNEIKTNMSARGLETIGRRVTQNEAVLETPILQDDRIINAYFDTVVQNPGEQGRQVIADQVNRFITELKDLKNDQKLVNDLRKTFKERLMSELASTGKSVYQERVENLCVWDALKIEADYYKTDLVQYVHEKFNEAKNKCKPYWNVNQAELNSLQVNPFQIKLATRDKEIIKQFEARNQVDLRLASLFDGFGDSALGLSKYEVKLYQCRAGVPLAFQREPGSCKGDFELWSGTRRSTPILVDKRLEDYLKTGPVSDDGVRGAPWSVDREKDMTEWIYTFLLGEHFDHIDSPLIRTGKSSGKYQYKTTLLGNKRKEALTNIIPTGQYGDQFEDIKASVNLSLRPLSDEELVDALVTTYIRLMYAYSISPDEEIRNDLANQYTIVALKLNKDFHMPQAVLDKEVKRREKLAKKPN